MNNSHLFLVTCAMIVSSCHKARGEPDSFWFTTKNTAESIVVEIMRRDPRIDAKNAYFNGHIIFLYNGGVDYHYSRIDERYPGLIDKIGKKIYIRASGRDRKSYTNAFSHNYNQLLDDYTNAFNEKMLVLYLGGLPVDE